MAYRFKHGDRPLEDYTIQRGVGRGGFGEVYYAMSDGGREVALKYLRDNPDIELRGVSACMNLKSPHLVTVFDVKKSAEGEYFIIMEYVSGPSLRDVLTAESDGLGPQKAAYFIREIAKGLGYLHDRGIVHRDLKPGNIFYEDGYVKIGDYGLSKFISVSRHSAQTASIGTVHYMAPEVGSGNYSRGIDIYALGVILYEMLLGKVPFEGSSMGEVLMKHLTEQPEVDQLPQPFGQVIRRALAKDPNDRYQTVEEMVEALLDVDDIKRSVAGFNPTSLSAAARHVAGDFADSPVPSPNPVRPAERGPAADVGPPREWVPARRPEALTPRLGKRLDRISRKVDKKLKKLGGSPQRAPAAVQSAPRRGGHRGQAVGQPAVHFEPGERGKRILLSGVMTLGIAVGIGLLIGTYTDTSRASVAGVSSFLLVAAISTGVMISRWLLTTKLPADSPAWVQQLVRDGCCLPLMPIGAAPALAELGDRGLGALGALAIVVLALTKWDDLLQRGAAGEMRLWTAIWYGVLAGILAGLFGAEEFCLMAGGVTAAAVLSVQALGWAFQPRVAGAGPQQAGGHQRQPWQAEASPPLAPAPGGYAAAEPPTPPYGQADTPGVVPMGIPVAQHLRGVSRASNAPLAPLRSNFARGVWSVLAFLLAGGMIALFIVSLVAGPGWCGDLMGVISGCVACFSFLIFALRKTTPRKRLGFWRETLRPFLIAVAMTGLGASISALSICGMVTNDEELALAIFGVVYSSVLFLVLLVFRGRRPKPSYVAGECCPADCVPGEPGPESPDQAGVEAGLS